MAWAAGMPVAAAVARVQSGFGSLRAVPFSSIHDAHASDARLRPSKISLPAPLSQARAQVSGSGSGMPDRFFHNETRTPPLDADNPGGRLGFGNLAGFVVGAQQA